MDSTIVSFKVRDIRWPTSLENIGTLSPSMNLLPGFTNNLTGSDERMNLLNGLFKVGRKDLTIYSSRGRTHWATWRYIPTLV
jgi:hypothetical protein